MEIMEYTPPVSWTDRDMDWEYPIADNIDYCAAIIEAIKERADVVKYPLPQALFTSQCTGILNYTFIETIRAIILSLGASFVDFEYQDYELNNPQKAYPRLLNRENLLEYDECRALSCLPTKGCLSADLGAFFKATKNALDRMTVILYKDIEGNLSQRKGSWHDPPTQQEAIDQAVHASQYSKEFFSQFPQEIYNKAGNTHYNSNPGYCGYVELQMISFTVPDLARACDYYLDLFANKCQGLVPYAAELQYSVFDSGPINIIPGYNRLFGGPLIPEKQYTVGSVDFIPDIPPQPVSNFPHRCGSWRGFSADVYLLADYRVENGFRFFSIKGD